MTSHRAARAGIAACLLALCLTPRAFADPQVGLTARFAPDRAGQNTTIFYGFKISEPAPVRSMELRLPAGMGFGTSSLGLEECTATTLIEHGPGGCPPNSRVGFGTAIARVPRVGLGLRYALTEQLKVTVLLAPPQNETITVLVFVEGRTPVEVDQVLTAKLVPVAKPFGDALNIQVPALQAWAEGPFVGITSFRSTLGPHGLLYLEHEDGLTFAFHPRGLTVPENCPRDGFPVEARFTWWNSPQAAVARVRVPCPAGRR